MKLIVKFNAVLLVVGALGFAATAVISDRMLQDKARAESLQNARLLLEAAQSARAYTDDHIVRLLENQMQDTFLPESVPSFAAGRCSLRCTSRCWTTRTRTPRSIPPTCATAPPTGKPMSSTSSARTRTRRRSSASAKRQRGAR